MMHRKILLTMSSLLIYKIVLIHLSLPRFLISLPSEICHTSLMWTHKPNVYNDLQTRFLRFLKTSSRMKKLPLVGLEDENLEVDPVINN